jgi:hypothetical protein
MEPAGAVAEDEDRGFWLAASASSLRKIWGNPADGIYAQLLNGPEDATRESHPE